MKKLFMVFLAALAVCLVSVGLIACNESDEEKNNNESVVEAVSITGAEDYAITAKVADFSFLRPAVGLLSDGTSQAVNADTSEVKLGTAGEYDLVFSFSAGGKTITETKKVRIYGEPTLQVEDKVIYYNEAGSFDVRTMAAAHDSFGNELEITVVSDGGFAADRYVYKNYEVSFSVTDPALQVKTATAELEVVRDEENEPVLSGFSFDAETQELIINADLSGKALFCVETADGIVLPERDVRYDDAGSRVCISAKAFQDLTDTRTVLIIRSTHGYKDIEIDFAQSPVEIAAEGWRFTREVGAVVLPETEISAFGSITVQKTLRAEGGETSIDVSESIPQDLEAGIYELTIVAENSYGNTAQKIFRLEIRAKDEYDALIDDMGSTEHANLYREINYVGSVNGYVEETIGGVKGGYKIDPIAEADASGNVGQWIVEPFATDLSKYRWLSFDVCISDPADAGLQLYSEFYSLKLRDGLQMPFTADEWSTVSIDLQYLYDYNNAGLTTDVYGLSVITKNHSKPIYLKNLRWVSAEDGLRSSFEGAWEVSNELYIPVGVEGMGATAEINQDPAYVTHGEKSLRLTALGGGFNFVVNHAVWFDVSAYTHFSVDIQLVAPAGTENAVAVLYQGGSPWADAASGSGELRPGEWHTIQVAIPAGSTYIQFTDLSQPIGGGGVGAGWTLYMDNLRAVRK